MARIRSIKPEFFENEKLVRLGYASMMLYVGLWQQCDVAGRCEDRPAILKARVFPYNDEPVDELLDGLEKAKFIVRYEVDGERYIWVPTFRLHQRITGKEHDAGSKRPPAPGDTSFPSKPGPGPRGNSKEGPGENPAPTRDETEKHPGSTRETPGVFSDVLEGKGREGSNYKKVDREEGLPSDSSGDEPSGRAEGSDGWKSFWDEAGRSNDLVVKALCKSAFGIPKFRAVIPPSFATVERVIAGIRASAPHDAAILDEIEWFDVYWSSQSKITGKGYWWLSFGQWCKKKSGAWAVARKRGGLIAVSGGIPDRPQMLASSSAEIQAEARRMGI